ncbi:MAG: TatD family hydrolase [Clostridia bacterium]|nr:TatD family hydrolase [Clostridia bacterium]
MEKKSIENQLSVKGLFDSHAHYFDSRWEGQAEDLLENGLFGKGLGGIVNVATDPENALRCIEQAKRHEGMYAAVGIHPTDCKALRGSVDDEVSRIRYLLDTEEKRRENKIVALGEIGLDYHWEPIEEELQKQYFHAQMALAEELSLPVIIHDREAHGDCFETVLRYPKVRGVFHSFSGSAEMARELCRRGWYISFSGVVTFKNGRRAREAAMVVPMDRILAETDAPYLAPEPFRGRMNHSGLMNYTVSALSEIKGVSYEDMVRITAENARRLFGLA